LLRFCVLTAESRADGCCTLTYQQTKTGECSHLTLNSVAAQHLLYTVYQRTEKEHTHQILYIPRPLTWSWTCGSDLLLSTVRSVRSVSPIYYSVQACDDTRGISSRAVQHSGSALPLVVTARDPSVISRPVGAAPPSVAQRTKLGVIAEPNPG
jgi:hypothetical protein